MRRGFTLIELIVVIFIILILLALLGSDVVLILKTLWLLIIGWIYFLNRNLPRMEPHVESIVTGIVGLLLLFLLTHIVMRRFINRPAAEGSPERRWPLRATGALVGAIVLLFVAGVAAIGMTQQTQLLFNSDAPLTDRRGIHTSTASQNNLRHAGVAIHAFVEQKKHMPYAGTMSADGRALHSWQTQLLPYLEQSPLYKTIYLDKAWNDPANQPSFRNDVYLFRHPSVYPHHDDQGYAITTYAANVHALSFDRPMRFEDYPRGLANTMFVGEAAGNYKPWGHPFNVRDPKLGLHRSPDGFGGPRKGSTHFLMGDGSVRRITDDADPDILERIARGRE
jgi:prepilin-type N-terminal cleavage/methylation domain-containing protein